MCCLLAAPRGPPRTLTARAAGPPSRAAGRRAAAASRGRRARRSRATPPRPTFRGPRQLRPTWRPTRAPTMLLGAAIPTSQRSLSLGYRFATMVAAPALAALRPQRRQSPACSPSSMTRASMQGRSRSVLSTASSISSWRIPPPCPSASLMLGSSRSASYGTARPIRRALAVTTRAGVVTALWRPRAGMPRPGSGSRFSRGSSSISPRTEAGLTIRRAPAIRTLSKKVSSRHSPADPDKNCSKGSAVSCEAEGRAGVALTVHIGIRVLILKFRSSVRATSEGWEGSRLWAVARK
mmetsp:Transcript_67365/g.184755  ORF Transcript_67365/g.184755 Transcript_67365/m.184755 type:complete len:294 (-) Transcript_67365:4-885(-)